MRESRLKRSRTPCSTRWRTTPHRRLKTIMASAVKHLHAFAREVNLTPAEWIKGIEFMTAAGKMCSPERQEFILLSDTLGLSALVNGLHDATALEEATNTSLLGPFYREATPTLAAGSSIARNPKPGSECVLYGRVTDAAGKPVANATVSIWQTGADGLYDIQASATSVDYRGVFATDADGIPRRRESPSRSVIRYPWDGPVCATAQAQARHGMRPAQIHFLLAPPAIATGHCASSARRPPSRRRRRVWLVGRSRRRRGCQRSGLPDQGHAEHPLRHAGVARERGRQRHSGRVGADPAWRS